MEETCTHFRSASSTSRTTTAGIFVLFILIVPIRVNTQCPQCTGQSIKTINITTGECISCFPCPSCDVGQTSSVPCESTVPFGTDIKCVFIQSDHVSTAQASHTTATLQTISSSSKLVVVPITSVTYPVVASATSSTTTVRPSVKPTKGSDTTKKQKDEKALPLKVWQKNTMIYVFSGIILAITTVVIVYRIFKLWKSSKQVQLHVQPVMQPLPDVASQRDNETCNVSLATGTVTFTRHDYDQTADMEDGYQRSQSGIAQVPSSYLDAAAVNAFQPPTHLVPSTPCPQSILNISRIGSITTGMQQGSSVNWSALSQREKYQEKVLDMPFSLLNKICFSLDIPRPDGNDVRMLAEKFGISVGELALIKQAAIAQNPVTGNVGCNSLSYVVLTSKRALLTVGDFVDMMNDIERDDIVSLI